MKAEPNAYGCHDPQCLDSTWDHDCPVVPEPPSWQEIAEALDRDRARLRQELDEARAAHEKLKTDRILSVVFGHHKDAPRPFGLYRREDVSGVSGTGMVALGCEWPDGTVVLRWTSAWPTSVVFHDRGIESVKAVHGHDGRTEIVWLSDELPSLAEMEQRAEAAEAERDRLRQQLGEARTGWRDASGKVNAVEAERDCFQRDIAMALNVDDWEHPVDLFRMVRALRLSDEQAADELSEFVAQRNAAEAERDRMRDVAELLYALYETWRNSASAESTPEQIEAGWTQLLSLEDSHALDVAFTAIFDREPEVNKLLGRAATPDADRLVVRHDGRGGRVVVEEYDITLPAGEGPMRRAERKPTRCATATPDAEPAPGGEAFKLCVCGHPWLRHDIEEYRGDGSETCCVEGCDQVGCPGRDVAVSDPSAPGVPVDTEEESQP